MRVRTSIATAAALAAAVGGGAPPASAAIAGTVTMTITIGCFGCGVYGPAGNSVSFSCAGVCDVGGPCTGTCNYTGTGTASVPVDFTCLVTGAMNGSLATPYGPAPFALNWAPGHWGGYVDGASLAGTWAITNPVGLACGGSAQLTFVGAAAGT